MSYRTHPLRAVPAGVLLGLVCGFLAWLVLGVLVPGEPRTEYDLGGGLTELRLL